MSKLVQALLAPAIKVRRKKKKRYMVIDFRDNYIQLSDGTLIPRQNILNIDPTRKVIIYLDEKGMIREAPYADIPTTPEAGKDEKERKPPTAI